MTAQHLKFLALCVPLMWRPAVPSLNIVLTSLGWHNCSTHQNPGYVDTLLGRGLENVRIYTPSSPKSAASSFRLMMESYNGVNIMVIGKHRLPKLTFVINTVESDSFQSWRILHSANYPGDVVSLVGIGDYMVEECLQAKDIINAEYPDITVQVISVEEVSLLENADSVEYSSLFSALAGSASNVWAYIGYPNTIKGLLWDKSLEGHHAVVGYKDRGTVSSGLDRFVENEASRYHIAYQAIMNLVKTKNTYKAEKLAEKFSEFLKL